MGETIYPHAEKVPNVELPFTLVRRYQYKHLNTGGHEDLLNQISISFRYSGGTLGGEREDGG